MNAGAQKCVTQRVKNTPGDGPPAGTPENTRTWSMAMSTMTPPRMMSMDRTRVARICALLYPFHLFPQLRRDCRGRGKELTSHG